jgi:hypothetical protein
MGSARRWRAPFDGSSNGFGSRGHNHFRRGPQKTAREPRALPYLFTSFAQVSRSVTVRFHTCFSDVESGSSVK